MRVRHAVSISGSLVACGLVVAACGGASGASVPHLMVIMLENRSYSDIIGNRFAPFVNHLARTYETATNSYGVGHDSLDNYLAILSGEFDQWSTGDCSPGAGCQSSSQTLVDQLHSRDVSWRAYMGSMPTNCDEHNDDNGTFAHSYGVRHDPFVYFPRLVREYCDSIEPATNMLTQLDSSTPPDFVWLSPSICDDGGGDDPCATIANADAYLARELPAIEKTRWYSEGGTVVLTFDEGNAAGQGQGEHLTGEGNHIPTIVISNSTRGAEPYARYVNHFGVLAGIERLYKLHCLEQACNGSNGRLPLP